MKYPIIIERGPTNFSAYAPDFPGCAAAAGTEGEALALMQEALELHIADMRDRGLPLPTVASLLHELEIAA
jgi:predicted RNase H-like HicB family nuclease